MNIDIYDNVNDLLFFNIDNLIWSNQYIIC